MEVSFVVARATLKHLGACGAIDGALLATALEGQPRVIVNITFFVDLGPGANQNCRV